MAANPVLPWATNLRQERGPGAGAAPGEDWHQARLPAQDAQDAQDAQAARG